jgi:hypothetical protein
MTKLLDKAIEAARGLTPDEQDEIAAMILAMAENDDEGEDIDPEDLQAVERGHDNMRNGRFATNQEMDTSFRRFGSINGKDRAL